MTVNKRSKNSRQRGSCTHGWGSMKKHRGAGSRGGKGRAGSGKRADTKKTTLWKNKEKPGKTGFTSICGKKVNTITISDLEQHHKKYEEKNGILDVNLNKLGYDKLLSNGIVKHKFSIKIDRYSKKAKEKIENAGGEIIESTQEKKTCKTNKSQPKEESVEKSEVKEK